MKRINLKTITNALSKKEMMQFRGGDDPYENDCPTDQSCTGDGSGSGNLTHFICWKSLTECKNG